MQSKNTLLPEQGFVRLELILKVIPVGKSTWWAGVKSGRFPKSVKLGKRTTAWKAEDNANIKRRINSVSTSNTNINPQLSLF